MPLLTLTLQTWTDGDDDTQLANQNVIWKLEQLLERMKTSGMIQHFELTQKPE